MRDYQWLDPICNVMLPRPLTTFDCCSGDVLAVLKIVFVVAELIIFYFMELMETHAGGNSHGVDLWIACMKAWA